MSADPITTTTSTSIIVSICVNSSGPSSIITTSTAVMVGIY